MGAVTYGAFAGLFATAKKDDLVPRCGIGHRRHAAVLMAAITERLGAAHAAAAPVVGVIFFDR